MALRIMPQPIHSEFGWMNKYATTACWRSASYFLCSLVVFLTTHMEASGYLPTFLRKLVKNRNGLGCLLFN
jgi:hypothetical protein